MTSKPRIAWFSPISEASETSSAYLSRTLLPHLSKHFDIQVFSDKPETYLQFSSEHYLTARFSAGKPFDIYFYNLEDSPELAFSRLHLGLVPGVIFFHDFFFSNFGPEPILNSPWRETLKSFSDPTHAWPNLLSEFKQRGPGAFREAGYSVIKIFSSPRDHREFLHNVVESISDPKKRTYCLPYPAYSEASTLTPSANDSIFKVAYAGRPRGEDRPHKILKALSELTTPHRLDWLVSEKEKERAQAYLDEYPRVQAKLHTPRLPETWATIASQSDVALHVRFSGYGQLGPFFSISAGLGVPSIVTDFGGSDYLPDELFFKIKPGITEELELTRVLQWCARNSLDAHRKKILSYAREMFDPRSLAQDLSRLLIDSSAEITSVGAGWDKLSKRARAELIRSSQSLVNSDVSSDFLKDAFTDLGWNARP